MKGILTQEQDFENRNEREKTFLGLFFTLPSLFWFCVLFDKINLKGFI